LTTIVAAVLLGAVAAVLLLSPAHGLREYASMVIWCSIGAGVIGGCMIAGPAAFRRSTTFSLAHRLSDASDLEVPTGKMVSVAHCWGCSCSLPESSPARSASGILLPEPKAQPTAAPSPGRRSPR
jgi:hypothetical protein